MTAPRLREQRRPPSPPDRRPPRRSGSPSSKTASAAGRPTGFARFVGARRSLIGSARALAAAALLALSGGLALPATAEAQTCTLNPGDLWCGVVTVGAGASDFYGFFDATGTGALSDKGFSVGTTSYTIDEVSAASLFSGNHTFLNFSLTSALEAADQAKLVLHVGSAEFAFSAATGPLQGVLTYRWVETGLDWSSTSSVTLRLQGGAATNNAPVFSETSPTRTVAENSGVGDRRRQRRHADLQPRGPGRGFVRHRLHLGPDPDRVGGGLQPRGDG